MLDRKWPNCLINKEYLTQHLKGQCDMNFVFPTGEIPTSDSS